MSPRLFSVLVAVSLLANTALLTVLLFQRSAPPVFGQTADGGGRFSIGTEKGADQSPICFVMADGEKPQLLVYRVDPADGAVERKKLLKSILFRVPLPASLTSIPLDYALRDRIAGAH